MFYQFKNSNPLGLQMFLLIVDIITEFDHKLWMEAYVLCVEFDHKLWMEAHVLCVA